MREVRKLGVQIKVWCLVWVKWQCSHKCDMFIYTYIFRDFLQQVTNSSQLWQNIFLHIMRDRKSPVVIQATRKVPRLSYFYGYYKKNSIVNSRHFKWQLVSPTCISNLFCQKTVTSRDHSLDIYIWAYALDHTIIILQKWYITSFMSNLFNSFGMKLQNQNSYNRMYTPCVSFNFQ